MVKEHNVHLIIENHSGVTMQYPSDWFDSGRLADGYHWPSSVPNGAKLDVLCYERDWALAGCSGTVSYRMNNTEVTFGFSNPSVGTNKVGVGTSGRAVWDHMSDHAYSLFDCLIYVGGTAVKCQCRCTGGTTNLATVRITKLATVENTNVAAVENTNVAAVKNTNVAAVENRKS